MKMYTIFLVLSTLTLASCQLYPASGISVVDQTEETNGPTLDFAANISTLIVNTLTQKLQTLLEIFDVKLRLITFVRSIYTTENLILLRKSLDLAVRFGAWILNFIPTSADPNSSASLFLNLIFPQIDLIASGALGLGTTAIPVQYGPPVVTSTAYGVPSTATESSFRAGRSLNEEESKMIEDAVSLHKLIMAGDEVNVRRI